MPTPLPPVDPDTKLPPAIAAQAAAADAAHKQAYNTADPQPEPPVPPPVEGAPAPQPVPPPAANTLPPPAPVAPPEPPAPGDENLTAEQWRHRYLSMEGRYKQSAQTLGGLQEQLQELGDELMRTQQVMRRGQVQPQPEPAPTSLITEDERKTYGDELLDVVKRAAREAIMPDLQNTQSQVQQVNQRVNRQAQGGVHQQLTTAVPDWRSINVSPRFKAWCGLRDVYSGAVRSSLLNAAFQAADAPRVIAFFQGFLNEEQATGQLPPEPQPQPALTPPRTAAVSLDMLTAPGRAKPASGDSAVPVDKPIFTRAQIQKFYVDVRKGAYAGRDAQKQTDEAAIFAAQREGRVRG